ncbi:uncharacterized protein APUU_71098A [Aspergillus puulaauensis]|uniref:Uncharacterized protein n=1 Tax=Aspergillus puulaauensis TaxID=1220207 RepID=A0A7R8AU40_9EURO|nr:uncharacterized protein APUU_71098A [Aspergillus puulaauensis]BCS29528.1 hypothetical protein APUU_71098A [Aspergillus puulaauensis]
MGPRESSSRAASTKPWSSGRVLTPSQRERKRYKDRVSKQEKQGKENETLKHLQSQVVALQNALQSHRILPVPMSPDESVNSCLLSPPTLDTPLQGQPCTVLASPAAPFNSQKLPASFTDGLSTTWPAIPPSLQASDSYTILEFSDKVLREPSQFSILDICSDAQLNQDAIIRGVLEGWHFMENRAYSCPLWKIISQIDELIFMQSGILTRLAMLSTILKMLMAVVYENNFGEIPSWYRPRFVHLLIYDR